MASTFDAAIAAHRAGTARADRRRQLVDGLRVGDGLPDARRRPADDARRRSRPTASRSWRPSTSPAAPTSSTGCRTRSCGRSTASGSASGGRVRDKDVMSGNVKLALSHVVPDLVAQGAQGPGPAAHPRRRSAGPPLHLRRRPGPGIRLAIESPAAVNDDFNLSTAASRRRCSSWPRRSGARSTVPTAVPVRLRSAVRARRPEARARRPQGARGPRVRGDDDPRRDARRGHPVDPGRSGGRADLVTGLDDVYRQRFPEVSRRQKDMIWPEIARYLEQWVDPAAPVLDIACDSRLFHPQRPRGRALGRPTCATSAPSCPTTSISSRRTGSTSRPTSRSGTFGTVFMSNYLEHLPTAGVGSSSS